MLILILLLWNILRNVSCYPSRWRRSEEIKYAPCKNIYPQCAEWKNKYKWCEDPQYKEYMSTVCPAACDFCRGSQHERSVIEHPHNKEIHSTTYLINSKISEAENGSGDDDKEPSQLTNQDKNETLLEGLNKKGKIKAYAVSKQAKEGSHVLDVKSMVSNNFASHDRKPAKVKVSLQENVNDNSVESAYSSGSGANDQNEFEEEPSGENIAIDEDEEDNISEREEAPNKEKTNLSKPNKNEQDDDEIDDKEYEKADSRNKGSSSSSKPVDAKKLASDFLPEELLPATQEERKEKEQEEFGSGQAPEGKLSIVLRQNFNTEFTNPKSTNYQMLAGNVKKDLEKVLKGTKVKDVTFSEATIEGNPRQIGKTRVAFILSGANQAVMKTLLKLVDEGNINGLAIIKSSLENDDD